MTKKFLSVFCVLGLMCSLTLNGCSNNTTVNNGTPSVGENAIRPTNIVSNKDVNDTISNIVKDSVDFDFSTLNTETISGEPFTYENTKDAKVIILNFWEPWCGPCVSEMPGLNKLYEEEKDNGLLIIGVYGTNQEDAEYIASEYEIAYPLIKNSEELNALRSDYVPTTYIYLSGGFQIGDMDVGAHPYGYWKEIVSEYLK